MGDMDSRHIRCNFIKAEITDDSNSRKIGDGHLNGVFHVRMDKQIWDSNEATDLEHWIGTSIKLWFKGDSDPYGTGGV